MKKKLIVIVGLASVLLAGGGAAAWWFLRPHGAATAETAHAAEAASAASAAVVDKRPPKYVSLDKVIVMLRRAQGDTSTHYLALDLVLKTAGEDEKLTKEQLPMLRSVAVKVMANYTAEQATAMSIDQFAAAINTAYADSYVRDKRDKPFSEAMIGKLIIE
jgi:flagellar FliL protein